MPDGTPPLLVPPSTEAKHTLDAPDKLRHDPEEKLLRFQNVGVWTIMQDAKVSWSESFQSLRWKLDIKMLGILPLLSRFILECMSVGYHLILIYFFTALWAGAQPAVSLYFSSRVLDIMQNVIVDNQVDTQAMMIAVLSHVAFTITSCVVMRIGESTKRTLANRVRYLFEERLIQANLRLDFPTFQEPETTSRINKLFGYGHHGGAWEILEDLVHRSQGIASVVSQAGFLIGVLSANPGGRYFAVLCFGKAVFDRLTSQSLWTQVSYVWSSNPHYQRMNTLISMVTATDPRIEIASNVLANYIHREWTKARKLLGDLSDDYPSTILRYQRPLVFACIDAISEDFPLMFYAYQVLRHPASFSLTSVALMQQASSSLTYTISSIFHGQHSLQQRFNSIRTLYESSEIPNKLVDGELEYPQRGAETTSGMEISFQNVSFAYPLATENVIKDVSFTIRRGQIVMIVGVNGSGKSTLLKLFNRLYDPASGTIMVDGVPMSSFNSADLRRASAMLFQKFSHFPLSIRENISLGLPDEEMNTFEDEKKGRPAQDELVRTAARLGGSIDFIKDQPNGFDTVLQPRVNGYSTSSAEASKAFEKKVSEITKKVDVSSGQWQRLALSRLFFRAAGDKTKLVAVDEPSASLDPEMEYELFESLRDLSSTKGKTLIFVTHRFGYLTKRADLILVLQKGRLVEQGKHDELVQMGGEYAKLYNLQAEAFLPSAEPK